MTTRVSSAVAYAHGESPITKSLTTHDDRPSFLDNKQFGFFDRMELTSTDGYQVVYRITATKCHNLLVRLLDFYLGGVLYDIYEVGSGESFTGSLVDISSQIYKVNRNIRIPGRDTLPETSHTIRKASGVGIFTPGGNPITGASIRGGSNTQQSSGNLCGSINKLGYTNNLDVWAVCSKIDEVTSTSKGSYELIWEDLE